MRRWDQEENRRDGELEDRWRKHCTGAISTCPFLAPLHDTQPLRTCGRRCLEIEKDVRCLVESVVRYFQHVTFRTSEACLRHQLSPAGLIRPDLVRVISNRGATLVDHRHQSQKKVTELKDGPTMHGNCIVCKAGYVDDWTKSQSTAGQSVSCSRPIRNA